MTDEEFQHLICNFEPTREWVNAFCFALETDDRRHGEVAEIVLDYFVDAGLLTFDEETGRYGPGKGWGDQ